jgi:peptidoglycan hydrolase-like protein with peptidoglycan-binding domain
MKILVTENQLKKLINLITEDDDKINVMFVGDSLSDSPGNTWNYQLAKDHPEWNVTHVVKRGMKTDWMLTNMLSNLSKKKYDKVFIWGGTNNAFWVGSNLSDAVSDIQKMVDAVNNQGGQSYVFLGYAADSVMTDKNLKPTKKKDGTYLCDPTCMKKGRERMVQLQKDLSSQIKNATIIPTIDGDDSWAPSDGIHIGTSQHRTIKDYVSRYITQSKKENENQNSNENNDDKREAFKKFFENYFKFLEKNQNVDENSKKNDIKRMQIVLYLYLRQSTENKDLGKFDEQTKKDILDFQSKNGLQSTGYFDVKTQQELAKKLFPSYTPTQKTNSEDKKDSNNKESVDNVRVIENPGVQVRKYPSDLEQQFKNIPGVDYDKFKSDIESVGIPIKFAMRQLHSESGFSPDVISCKRKSRSGAMGLAQFMPTTWPTYGKGGDPCKPTDALSAYVAFMDKLVKKFPGRLDLAFSGYNSGPNLKIYKTALDEKIPFTDLKGKIPNESYAYAASILQT